MNPCDVVQLTSTPAGASLTLSPGAASSASSTIWKPASFRAWLFLTNHARVLLVIARDPDLRLRDIAAACHITERTVLSIVTDLERAGYLSRERDGRRTRYTLHPDDSLRHPAEADLPVRGCWNSSPNTTASTEATAPHLLGQITDIARAASTVSAASRTITPGTGPPRTPDARSQGDRPAGQSLPPRNHNYGQEARHTSNSPRHRRPASTRPPAGRRPPGPRVRPAPLNDQPHAEQRTSPSSC